MFPEPTPLSMTGNPATDAYAALSRKIERDGLRDLIRDLMRNLRPLLRMPRAQDYFAEPFIAPEIRSRRLASWR